MKINNLIFYIIFIMIILASFIVPSFLLMSKDYDFQMSIYDNNERKIDVEAEKIYLVKMIYDIQKATAKEKFTTVNDEKIVEYSYSEMIEVQKDLLDEINKLVDSNIIKDLEINDDSKIELILRNTMYKNDDMEYTFKNYILIIDGKEYELGIEEKSGKVLHLLCDKDQICEDFEKEQMLRNYINYLGLHIIDDWAYEDNILKSEKAGLMVVLASSYDRKVSILAINTIDKISSAPFGITSNLEY